MLSKPKNTINLQLVFSVVSQTYRIEAFILLNSESKTIEHNCFVFDFFYDWVQKSFVLCLIVNNVPNGFK